MRLVAVALIGVGLLGAANAAPLAEVEEQFISQEIGSATVAAHCPNYELVPNVGVTIGDRMGVGEEIRAAVVAAYAQTIPNQPFNRAYLIPEVTRRVNTVMTLLDQKRQDGSLCGLGTAYANRGWLRLKN